MERFTAYACHAIADGNACQRFAAIERLTAYPCYTIGNYYACQRPAVTERITSYACYGIIVVDIVVDDRRNDEICVCACAYAGYSACDAVGIDFISKPFGCLFEFCDSFFFKFYMASCTFGMAFAFFALVGCLSIIQSLSSWPVLGITVCFTMTAPQTEQCLPSVRPFSVHVAS